jgi:hypothetical protein
MTPAAAAARAYAAMWMEPDRDRRRTLLEQCWAVDGRMVARGRTLHGREAVWKSLEGFASDRRGRRIRLASEIDANDTSFRFRGVLEDADGTLVVEAHDVGEVDADGRIAVLYTFNGPLKDAPATAPGE